MTAVDEFGPVIDDIYDFAEAQGFEIDGITAGGRRGPARDQPAPRRPGEAGRRGLLFQAPDPRGGAAPRLLRHLHGQADRGRARLGDAHPPFDRRSKTGQEHLLRARKAARRMPSSTSSRACSTTCPRVIAVLAPYVNSYRRYVRDHAAPINLEWGRDNRTTGHPRAVSEPAAAPGGKPHGGDGLQPLPRHRGLARLRVSGADARGTQMPSAEFPATPMMASPTSRNTGRGARPLRVSDTADLHEVLGPNSAGSTIVKRTEYEEFLQVISPVGAGAPAAERLTR
jgi:glutamine synthetase